MEENQITDIKPLTRVFTRINENGLRYFEDITGRGQLEGKLKGSRLRRQLATLCPAHSIHVLETSR